MEELLRQNLRGELHDPLEPGTIIDDRWQLRRLLGAGGFGRVYEAWHLELDHPVAIKVLDARHGGPEARQRFREEARLMAGLSSEHLVRASDYGELPDGSPYFVMDLVEGRTLRELLRERLPMWRALELAEEILEGLALVHARGVIHGDIKPENVIVGEMDGKARLLDFGLAQTSLADDEGVGGTPQYMAPEMLFDEAQASARTDVYAVGTILYEMLTGRLPRWHVDMKPDMLLRAWEKKPKPDPVRMHCQAPEGLGEAMETLEELVGEALAREPTRRFKSAEQMLVDLRRLRPRLSPEATAPTLEPQSKGARSIREVRTTNRLPKLEERRRRVRPLAVVGIAAIVGLVGWGIWTATRPEPELERAAGGILVAAPEGANEAVERAHTAVCEALGGSVLGGNGKVPVICTEVPATDVDDVVTLADEAHIRVVVLVDGEQGDELLVRSTSHHRGNPLLANLDGLPLPADPSALTEMAPVLKAVVGAVEAADVEIPALDPERVGERWVVLAEWFRVQQGHSSYEDRERRGEIRRALGRAFDEARGQDEARSAGFYRDLGDLLSAISSPCAAEEPMLRELLRHEGQESVIRVAALLELTECLLHGNDVASRVAEAESLLIDAFGSSRGDPCVRVAAIGSMSWIDRWNGGDAMWEANEAKLPGIDKCDESTWSQVLAVRGDALVERKRWCDASKSYERAYGILRRRIELLLNWAEYDWLCNPDLDARRQELRDELRAALSAEQFAGPQQRLSVAYMQWWLSQDPAAAQAVVDRYEEVPEGEVALLDGVASDLEPEICKGTKPASCSRAILARQKRAGDAERLRQSLGLD